MSKIINTSAAPEKVKLPARVKIVAGIAVLVLAGIGVAASIPSVRQSVSNTYSDLSDPGKGPCGTDRGLISSYNKAASAKDFKKVAELAKTARQKPAYQTDSTCLYISLMGYATSSDTASGFKDYDALMKLVQAGDQPSRRIDDGINKNDFYSSVKKFEQEKPENPRGEG